MVTPSSAGAADKRRQLLLPTPLQERVPTLQTPTAPEGPTLPSTDPQPLWSAVRDATKKDIIGETERLINRGYCLLFGGNDPRWRSLFIGITLALVP